MQPFFKAQIRNIQIEGSYKQLRKKRLFTFHKRKIWLSESQKELKIRLQNCSVYNGIPYTLEKKEDDDGEVNYQITIGNNCTAFLKVNLINSILLAYSHHLLKFSFIKGLAKKGAERGVEWLVIGILTLVINYFVCNNNNIVTKVINKRYKDNQSNKPSKDFPVKW